MKFWRQLPIETLHILLDIINETWKSDTFPESWREALIISIPKPGKDHFNPLNNRPIALTSCICKTVERMVNERLVWYLEKNGLLAKEQCGYRANRSTVDHLIHLETFIRDAFIQNQHLVAVFFDLQKAYDTTYSAYFCVRISQGPANPGQNQDNPVWRILPRGRCSNWWCPSCDMFSIEDKWAAHLYCQGYLQSTLCWWPGNLFSWALPEHHRETFAAGSKCHTGMGDKEWFQVCGPQVQIVHFTAPQSRTQRPPTVRVGNTSASGGVNKVPWAVVGLAHLIQEAHQCVERHSVRMLSTSSEWLLIWSGEIETHFWCYTGPLFTPSWTTVALCMAQHRTPIYDNWTVSITQDWDWHWEHSAPAQCPACTQRPTKLRWRNAG